MVIKERYQAAKARAQELSNDNEDLLRKILDVMNKVSKFERLRFKAKENTKAITERAEALEKELQQARTTLAGKDAKLKRYVAADDAKIQEAYYQGQYDCITTVKLKVQQNLQVYFTKGWIAALEKLEVEAVSPLRQECNIPIPRELVIIPNPETQAIINDESLVREVEVVGPAMALGREAITSIALSSTEELARV